MEICELEYRIKGYVIIPLHPPTFSLHWNIRETVPKH